MIRLVEELADGYRVQIENAGDRFQHLDFYFPKNSIGRRALELPWVYTVGPNGNPLTYYIAKSGEQIYLRAFLYPKLARKKNIFKGARTDFREANIRSFDDVKLELITVAKRSHMGIEIQASGSARAFAGGKAVGTKKTVREAVAIRDRKRAELGLPKLSAPKESEIDAIFRAKIPYWKKKGMEYNKYTMG